MDQDEYSNHTRYSNALLQGLKSLYEDSQLCDIVIKVGERDFLAHKAILATTSNYFKAMFTSGFKESQQREVKIDGNPDAFEVLLKFVYTGRVDVTEVKNHMFDLFQMALYMDFKEGSWSFSEVFTELILWRIESVPVDEVCKVFFLARDHDNDDEVYCDLDDISLDFLMDNLGVLKDTEVFMQNATVKFMEEFLCRWDLANKKEEKQVLELVVNWLKFNWEERQDFAPQLLPKVKLGQVSKDDMKEIMGPAIYAVSGCSELLSKGKKLRDSRRSKYTLATRTSITDGMVIPLVETMKVCLIRFGSWTPSVIHPVVFQSNSVLFRLNAGIDQFNLRLEANDITLCQYNLKRGMPTIFFNVTPKFAIMVRQILKMVKDGRGPYFDPCSTADCEKRVIIRLMNDPTHDQAMRILLAFDGMAASTNRIKSALFEELHKEEVNRLLEASRPTDMTYAVGSPISP